jgi:trans-aconitate 2-methyltransferase
MTEWNAAAYVQRSSLQEAMAAEVLALLRLDGNERVLDIGCGDGRVTSEIARRLPHGSVVGVDASHDMITFAQTHAAQQRNLNFEIANAATLSFQSDFDLIVSFNALHWLPDPNPPLRCIRAAMKPTAHAQLRLVPLGPRKSLETIMEETRQSPRWAKHFQDFTNPYLRATPEEYAAAAERNHLRAGSLHVSDKSWDFQSRENFFAFGSVTFVEWTRRVPDSEKPAFINDVLGRYQTVAAATPAEAHTFKFYQLDITLSPA